VEAARAVANTRGATREAFLAEHQSDADRLSSIARRIESGLARHLRDVGREPPAYLVAALGPVPDHRRRAAAWWRGARAVETYRARAGVDDEASALGAEPIDAPLARQWEQTQSVVARTARAA